MDTAESQVVHPPPSLIKALMAGFDAITNHLGLILFPIALDLLLWFGPHVSMMNLLRSYLDRVMLTPEASTPEIANMLNTGRELWLVLLERFNLLGVLRAYPVGIPSLMVSRAPVGVPGGAPLVWQAPSFGSVILFWLLLTLTGLVIGTLYFAVVSQAALLEKPSLRNAVEHWPWASKQVILLALFWLGVLLVISIPFSCVVTILLLSGVGLGGFAPLIYGGLLIWLLLPLVFSPHGIFVNQRHMWASVRDGAHLVRLTLPTTGLLILIILVLSEGLDTLWRVPPETSWLSLVGLVGHAFVTTGLLATTFVYYRDTDRWIKQAEQKALLAKI
jgi:hypothetical protein